MPPKKPKLERFLLSAKSLAVMRVDPTGDLNASQSEWAKKFDAVLVSTESSSADTALVKKIERMEAKNALVHDVLEQFQGNGKDDPWNYSAMIQAIKIIKGMVKE